MTVLCQCIQSVYSHLVVSPHRRLPVVYESACLTVLVTRRRSDSTRGMRLPWCSRATKSSSFPPVDGRRKNGRSGWLMRACSATNSTMLPLTPRFGSLNHERNSCALRGSCMCPAMAPAGNSRLVATMSTFAKHHFSDEALRDAVGQVLDNLGANDEVEDGRPKVELQKIALQERDAASARHGAARRFQELQVGCNLGWYP